MKRFLFAAFALAIGLYCISSPAQWNGCQAGFCNPAQAGASTFQGVGNVFSTSPYAGYSCARAYTAAYANAGSNACLIQRASDNAQCTIKFSSTGYADLATAYCNSNTQTIVQFCNATTCRVMTAYDMTGNSRDVIQATFASAPTLAFNDTPKGTLPAIVCSGGTLFLATSSTFSANQPLTFSGVVIVTTGGAQGGAIGGQTASPIMGSGTIVNNLAIYSSTELDGPATDNTWHSVNGLALGASSAIKIDTNSEVTGNAGGAGWSNQAIRLCRAATITFNGKIAEAYIFAATSTSTDRTNIAQNQHGPSGYNF